MTNPDAIESDPLFIPTEERHDAHFRLVAAAAFVHTLQKLINIGNDAKSFGRWAKTRDGKVTLGGISLGLAGIWFVFTSPIFRNQAPIPTLTPPIPHVLRFGEQQTGTIYTIDTDGKTGPTTGDQRYFVPAGQSQTDGLVLEFWGPGVQQLTYDHASDVPVQPGNVEKRAPVVSESPATMP